MKSATFSWFPQHVAFADAVLRRALLRRRRRLIGSAPAGQIPAPGCKQPAQFGLVPSAQASHHFVYLMFVLGQEAHKFHLFGRLSSRKRVDRSMPAGLILAPFDATITHPNDALAVFAHVPFM